MSNKHIFYESCSPRWHLQIYGIEFFYSRSLNVGVESDQHVNICCFDVRCDRMWPSTQWHRVYTGSGNVPYIQFESVGDFIPGPRCSKFVMELQMEVSKMGVQEVRSNSGPKGREWRELLRALSIGACALCGFRVSKASRGWIDRWSFESLICVWVVF